MKRLAALLCALLLTACASLSDRARDSLEQPGLEGTRWGLVVMTLDGRELVSIRPDERFLPASNTKLFTTAAAFHRLGDMAQPDPSRGTSLRLVPRDDGPPTLVLVGAGDPTLIDAEDCERNCLAHLADALIEQQIDQVANILVDTSLFPYEPWPPGWSHEDRVTRSGAPVAAMTVNSNEVRVVITPGPDPGTPATVELADDLIGVSVLGQVETVSERTTPDDLVAERHDGSSLVRIHGRISAGAPPLQRSLAVDDPAITAGLRFGKLLAERGVKVLRGNVEPILRDRTTAGMTGTFAPPSAPPMGGVEVARLIPPPLIENVSFINKESQNLHAELLLRRLGLLEGDGSRQAGLKVVEAMLIEAGIPRWTWDFADGSGMSVYNRVTPQTTADFLLWTTTQPWAEAFRETLPIGGVDGTIRRRFTGTSLEGRIFAKTGTLRGTNALSGFMMTKSGLMLVFSAFANERPTQADSAIAALDATLVAISETN